MTSGQLEKRRRVMQRSMKLGHCICDVRRPCPCDVFTSKSICPCAGETVPPSDGPVRLTQHVRNAGCASKIGKSILQEVLRGLPQIDDERVLVGSSAGDDAGVILLSPDTATILTVDVFSPSVDDPYTFGQIAAANSLSDIYAMGGTPQVALSIIGFPIDALPPQAMREILRGGIEKMREAGVPVIGGHSINDEELKCGFAVVGTSPPRGYIRNAGAQVGDRIVLTKPLGGGILAFAHQLGRVAAPAMDAAARSMTKLNCCAAKAMLRHHVHAATDVTGFGLVGHLVEILSNSNVAATLVFDDLPLLDPAVQSLARQDVLPGAVERNRESVPQTLLEMQSLTPAQQAILFGPETSGGLMVFLSETDAAELVREMHAAGEAAWVIGEVTVACAGGRIAIRTHNAEAWGPLPVEQLMKPDCCGSVETDAQSATGADGLPAPAAAEAFHEYSKAVNAPGALDGRQKRLINVALSVLSKCEPCVRIHAKAAREAGASDAEISEAAALGIAFGGAPVAMFFNTLRQKTSAVGGGAK